MADTWMPGTVDKRDAKNPPTAPVPTIRMCVEDMMTEEGGRRSMASIGNFDVTRKDQMPTKPCSIAVRQHVPLSTYIYTSIVLDSTTSLLKLKVRINGGQADTSYRTIDHSSHQEHPPACPAGRASCQHFPTQNRFNKGRTPDSMTKHSALDERPHCPEHPRRDVGSVEDTFGLGMN